MRESVAERLIKLGSVKEPLDFVVATHSGRKELCKTLQHELASAMKTAEEGGGEVQPHSPTGLSLMLPRTVPVRCVDTISDGLKLAMDLVQSGFQVCLVDQENVYCHDTISTMYTHGLAPTIG